MRASSASLPRSRVAGLWLPPAAAPAFSPALRNAILASSVIHAAILSLRFTFPDLSRLRSLQTLEVVLVNAKSSTRPTNPDAIAQANLDRGGDTDENRQTATPLPVTREAERGDSLKRTRKRVTQLEAKQRQVMTQTQTQTAVPTQPTKPKPSQKPQPVSTTNLLNSTLALARLEAQIARQVEEYNKH